MSAPRLLDKKVVTAEVATQKAQQIKEGLMLAKKVDALRETKQEEEGKLETFRKETIARVQTEIDAKIREKDALEKQNKRLREERIEAQAPIDLKAEWLQVRLDRVNLTTWNQLLTESQIEVVAKEAGNKERTASLDHREGDIKAKERLTERTLSEAETKFTQASDTFERAQRDSDKLLANCREKENHLRVREEDATNREIILSKREEEVQAHEIDLANREKKLRVNQEVFIKAQKYIKSKKS